MRAAIGAAALVLCCAPATAAPAADVVVYWATAGAPGELSAAAAAATADAGAAFFDRSPRATPVVDVAGPIAQGRTAYENLRFEEAIAAFDQGEAALAGGGADVSRADLADLFLYRALARIQLGGDDAAWDDLVTAARLAPGRVLDPARFPPRAIAALTRADQEVAGQPPASLTVAAPPGCQLSVDGAAASSPVRVSVGDHWLAVACASRPRWGVRVTVPPAGVTVEVPPLEAPSDDAALIQARALGARAVVIVAVLGTASTMRRLGVDGREQDRRTAAAAGDAIAAGVTALLTPPRAAQPWYRSRWTWAAIGAVTATAVLIPFLAQGTDARTISIQPTGVPW